MLIAALASRPFSAFLRLCLRSRGMGAALMIAAMLLAGGTQAARADDCAAFAAPGYAFSSQTSGYFSVGDVLSLTTASPANTVMQMLSPGGASTTNLALGATYTITTTGIWNLSVPLTSTVRVACTPPPQKTFTVTTTADDANGIPANCATGSTTACTLRDAVAAAAAAGGSGVTGPFMVNFASSLAGTSGATPFTIVETGGAITVAPNTTIQGLTTGSGSGLTNLVTVNGNAANSVFLVAANTTGALNNLTITNGLTTPNGSGGGVSNQGSLTVSQCTITANRGYTGGAISSTGTSNSLTVLNSTLSNNVFASGLGGAIYSSAGNLTLTNSTLTGNSTSYGGGLYLDNNGVSVVYNLTNVTIAGNTATFGVGGVLQFGGTLNIVNSILEANNAPANQSPDFFTYSSGTVSPNYISLVNSTNTSYTLAQVGLAPLGYYGGPTQTMPAMPVQGSGRAFCSKTENTATSPTPTTADQRGAAPLTTYDGVTYCIDSGATNSHFSLVWTTEPSSTATYFVGQPLNPAPVLQFEDDGAAFPYAGTVGYVVSYTGGGSAYTTQTLNSSGSYAFGLTFPSAEMNVTLSASANSLISGGGGVASGATTPTFNVIPSIASFSITSLSSVTAGTVQNMTITAKNADGSTSTSFTGPATVTSTDTAAYLQGSQIGSGLSVTFVSGVATLSGASGLQFRTIGTSQTLTVTYGTVTATTTGVAVTSATASTITAATGSGQSAKIGAAFPNALQVQVLDAYSNPVSGNTVTFTVPTTGASATLSATTCSTDTTGKCSVAAAANGTASATAYSVTAKATGVTTGTTFTLMNNAVVPTLTVTASPTTLVYGQPVTITATSSPVSAGGSSPTSAVTFYDSGTTLTPTSTPTAGVATFATTALVGAQIYGASTAGDTNFAAVAKTTAAGITVSKATSTLTGPTTQPVLVIVGSAGPIAINVTGQYSGAGISTPTGNVSYQVTATGFTPISGAATIASGLASISLPTTLSPGAYTLVVTYGGDGNYTVAPLLNVAFQIGQLTPTVTYPAQTAITYGTTLTAALNATTAYNGTSLATSGTTAYTATLLPSGAAVAVTPTTVLAAGTYTLTATWTPNTANAATYKSASAITTLTVNAAPLTVKADSFTISYGQTVPAYMYAITGFVNGDTAASVVTGTALLSTTPAAPTATNTYAITPTIGSLSATNYSFTTFTPGTLTITLSASAITMAQSHPTPVNAGTGVGVSTGFTFAVTDATANSVGAPSGTIQLFNGTTLLGTTSILHGLISPITVTFDTVGTVQLTAKYLGDANFNPSTSAVFSEVVVTPDVSGLATPNAISITQGSTGASTITFTPVGNYTGYASLSCGTVPANSDCVFTPSTVTFDGTDSTATSTISFTTTAPAVRSGPLQSGLVWLPAIALAVMLFVRKRKVGGALLAMVVSLAMMSSMGCNDAMNSIASGTPKGTSNVVVNVNVTGTGPSGSKTINVSIPITVN